MQPAFSLNRASPVAKATLIVVDECSMVDEALGRDLLSFGTPVLVLGDPGQLPPVKAGEGGGGYFTEAEPDVMLTEIHRQARENPIIALAQTVREGGRPSLRALWREPRHRPRRHRRRAGARRRPGAGRPQPHPPASTTAASARSKVLQARCPSAGDKLVCLRNSSEKGLLNGGLWRVSSVVRAPGPSISMLVKSEDEGPQGNSAKIRVLRAMFEEGPEAVSWEQRRRIRRVRLRLRAHRPQGSGLAMGQARALRRELCVSRYARALALYGHHARGGADHDRAVRRAVPLFHTIFSHFPFSFSFCYLLILFYHHLFFLITILQK